MTAPGKGTETHLMVRRVATASVVGTAAKYSVFLPMAPQQYFSRTFF